MDLLKWKKLKKSGAFRRKVKRNYEQFSMSDVLKDEKDNEILPECCIKELVAQEDCQNTKERQNNAIPHTESNNCNFEEDNEFKKKWCIELEQHENEGDLDYTDIEKNIETYKQMRLWATSFNISHAALKELLKIFNFRFPNILPHDPRTLLKTQKIISTIKMKNGEYWHNGLRYCLEKYLSPLNIHSVSINVNLDGLPVFNSSRQEFWPILCNISELPKIKPMIIGIFCGIGKPAELQLYLREFVEEAKVIFADGLLVSNINGVRKMDVKLRCFICDSPARALIKGVTNFNGKEGCLKCTTIGEYSHLSHTVFFPRSGCEKRTNEGFRSKQYGSHHKQDSPLLELQIDMVEDFPVGDSLHLIDLGIMKKCLVGWRDGSFGTYKTKWCARDIKKVTEFLQSCRMPFEIHRSVRGLDVLAYWKGTEYHCFLHYISIVILKEVLEYDVYKHFLLFYCAVTICSSEKYFHFLDLASTLFNNYVEYYRDFYGADYISSNVHNLTHVVDEVKKFGVLSTFNAYPFENRLYQIKKLLRNGNCPLAQVAKRLSEITQVEACVVAEQNVTFPHLKNKNLDGQYLKVELADFTLSFDPQNKWFLTKKDEIVKMQYALVENEEIHIYGYALKNIKNVFDTPLKSSFLNIYKSDCSEFSLLISSLDNIKCKMVAISCPSKNETIFIPLVHTL